MVQCTGTVCASMFKGLIENLDYFLTTVPLTQQLSTTAKSVKIRPKICVAFIFLNNVWKLLAINKFLSNIKFANAKTHSNIPKVQ